MVDLNNLNDNSVVLPKAIEYAKSGTKTHLLSILPLEKAHFEVYIRVRFPANPHHAPGMRYH